MTIVKFTDIEQAFAFVSSAGYGLHTAILDKDTGRLFFRSELGDLDETAAEDLDWDRCLEIPHQNDLGLGQELVFEFVDRYWADEYHRVRQIFRIQGAYRRFKHLLESRGLLERWYAFENRRTEQALRQWCVENEIDLSGKPG